MFRGENTQQNEVVSYSCKILIQKMSFSLFLLCFVCVFVLFSFPTTKMVDERKRNETRFDTITVSLKAIWLVYVFNLTSALSLAQTLATRVFVKNTGGACLCALLSALSFSSKSHPCFSTYNLTVCVSLFVLNYVSFLSLCVLLCLFALMTLTVVTKFAFCKVSSLRFSASGLFFTRQQKGRNNILVVARHVN